MTYKYLNVPTLINILPQIRDSSVNLFIFTQDQFAINIDISISLHYLQKQTVLCGRFDLTKLNMMCLKHHTFIFCN